MNHLKHSVNQRPTVMTLIENRPVHTVRCVLHCIYFAHSNPQFSLNKSYKIYFSGLKVKFCFQDARKIGRRHTDDLDSQQSQELGNC